MAQTEKTIVVAIDLGTGSQTATHAIVEDSFSLDGTLRRDKRNRVAREVRDWPGSNNGNATGNVCVPSIQVHLKNTRQLLFWGFEAQEYLNEPYPDPPLEEVYVIEHPKLLLADSEKYQAEREEVRAVLGKSAAEAFEDGLKPVVKHVMDSANRDYFGGINSCKVELILAFPSGWSDRIHTIVAGCGARAMREAISSLGLQNMVFGIENVYTVSETLCGAKEWLKDTVREATVSLDLVSDPKNLDQLNEGDCFLATDIGAGTGCVTPFKLVSKDPLRIDQLGRTQSLEVSGEAVQAEFKRLITPTITAADFPGDIPRLIYHICRKFNEKKKDCGLTRHHSSTWNLQIPHLRPNPSKNFYADCMKIAYQTLDASFDPSLNILEAKLLELLEQFPEMKAIVFLGQLGGSSQYLRNRMSRSQISQRVKIRHSQSGKLNVVKGALSERMSLGEKFVRKYKPRKSYGTIVLLHYYTGSPAESMFPNPQEQGAVPFERHVDGDWLTVIEWAIPRDKTFENSNGNNVGQDGRRHHTWKYREQDISFEDIIIVSEEVPPVPQYDGKSYTLWTEAHEQNQLVVDGQRMDVQQIPFSWDLTMSQQLNANGQHIGSYSQDDLLTIHWPEKFVKGKRRWKLRMLEYDLIWDITEMQVKVYIRALFPNANGPPTTQLAKEREIGLDEKVYTGESRSTALQRDIVISGALDESPDDEEFAAQNDNEIQLPGVSDDANVQGDQNREVQQHQLGTQGLLFEAPANSIHQQVNHSSDSTLTKEAPDLPRPIRKPEKSSSSGRLRSDGRRREGILNPTHTHEPNAQVLTATTGCYTCKARKKKCDCILTFDEATATSSCQECLRWNFECHMTDPPWAKNPSQLSENLLEWKQQISRKRKSAESDSPRTSSRDHSMTMVAPLESSSNQTLNMHSRTPTMGGLPMPMSGETGFSRPRGVFTARRGGKEGSGPAKHVFGYSMER
ncbi:hypothetical protein G7Y89_g13472 [Cudoniella acicularis]|uniref:Zn(2)-C6 fungal-type domain-containing protein n=1 Tax=Cudoniella acicularis TaxID=354080 RepID=A0A8H4R9S9_9HELO|nr:hypothetical protein G7Y89_g13472 [Cudoniella acicularis]